MDDRREAAFVAEQRLGTATSCCFVSTRPLPSIQLNSSSSRLAARLRIAVAQRGNQRAVGIQYGIAHGLATPAMPGTGGVPWVWNDLMVCRPQAWPFLRSASLQRIGFQSGASTSRAPAQATSTRLPPGS